MSDKFYVVSKGTKLFYENGKRIPAADAEGRNFRERTSSCKEGKEKSPFSGRCVKPCPDDKPLRTARGCRKSERTRAPKGQAKPRGRAAPCKEGKERSVYSNKCVKPCPEDKPYRYKKGCRKTPYHKHRNFPFYDQ